eukprot:44755-Prymnesium_polylepis.1
MDSFPPLPRPSHPTALTRRRRPNAAPGAQPAPPSTPRLGGSARIVVEHAQLVVGQRRHDVLQ